MTTKSVIEKVVKSLKANRFNPVIYVEKAIEAVDIILDMIPSDASLEMAGSMSVAQLGILDRFRERGNKGLDFPKSGELPLQEMSQTRKTRDCELSRSLWKFLLEICAQFPLHGVK
jgi:hypothetical protein